MNTKTSIKSKERNAIKDVSQECIHLYCSIRHAIPLHYSPLKQTSILALKFIIS